MSKIRTIKPDLWTDPDFVELSIAARLLFIGSWNFADDYGLIFDDPRRLQLQVLPGDSVDATALVNELVEHRFFERLTAPDGTRLLRIRTFTVHQRIDKRTVGRWGDPAEWSVSTQDPATSPQIPTDPAPGREGKGREWNGGGVGEGDAPGAQPPPLEPASASPPPTEPEPKAKKARQLPEGWTPSPSVLDTLGREHPRVDLQAELEKFTDHARSKGRALKDWDAGFRNWVRNGVAKDWVTLKRNGHRRPPNGDMPGVVDMTQAPTRYRFDD